ncbi:MAG: TonB-dependent receptor [Candidatus Cryptobacteroides sp.]
MRRFFLTILVAFAAMFAHAQNATITGVITDAATKDYLTGTSIVVKGTTHGTIADANGNYRLFIPVGKQVVQFAFLGYITQEVEVNLSANEVKVLNIAMKSDSEVLQGVVVSAQAKGQTAAINSQINAAGIMNAVSGEKLSELPDVNVADAIGRLPGLMIQRDGGEGQKIVIRGLSPKYNTVSFNGMNAPSTSESDRSTDLNMISPDMIASAEVMKANTADKDADGLGGTVNLVLKDAPAKFKASVTAETGYHSQINNIGRYKVGLNLSNRFFKSKLGMILSASYDRTDRSNDTFSASYSVIGDAPTEGLDYRKPDATKITVMSNLEVRTRYNVNLNFDLDLGNGNKLKFSNIFSNLGRDRDQRSKIYNFGSTRMSYTQTDSDSYTSNLSNVLQGDFNILGSTLSFGAGHSSTWVKTPWSNQLEFRIDNPFLVPLSQLEKMEPYLAISSDYVNDSDMSLWYLFHDRNVTQRTNERELSAWIDWKLPFKFGSVVDGYFKIGAKYRQKDRTNESVAYYRRFDLSAGYEPALERMPDLTLSADGETIGIVDFLDNSYKNKGNFLRGLYPNCDFAFALDDKKMKTFYQTNQDLLYKLLSETVKNDYTGHEEIYAGYVMGEFNFGKWVTFIPGVRYDFTRMRYNAYSGASVSDSESTEQQFGFEPTSDKQRFGYFLPQIHLKIKPAEWMDIRLAYTETLSRPDYDKLAPRTLIYPTANAITWSRTNLKPSLSQNADVTISFYPNNWGLFTVGAFYKNIKNFIYTRQAVVLKDSETDAVNFELDPTYNGATITYPLNSPTDAQILGIEADAQIQFHQLDNFLKGLVLSANFTWMTSRMDYHVTNLIRDKNPNYVPGSSEPMFIITNQDVTYTDRLLDQPSWLCNVSIGYDYKRFSARISCNYQDGVLLTAQQRSDAADKVITAPFVKLDSQFKYTFNKWISIYASWSNMNFAVDRRIRYVTGYPQKTEYYGTTAYIGIKVNLTK